MTQTTMSQNETFDADDLSDVEDEHPPQDAGGKRKRKVKDSTQEDGPACHACRRKKAKCSRTQPCSQCHRYKIECVYEEKKSRPGFKTGAIENLNRRLDSLEKMFLGQGVLWEQVLKSLSGNTRQQIDLPTPSTGGLQEHSDHLQRYFTNLATSSDQDPHDTDHAPHTKKRRVHEAPNLSTQAGPATGVNESEDRIALPPDDLVDSLVKMYFSMIHPWIPMLHVRKFREAIAEPAERTRKSTILYAITSVCVRFSNDPRLQDPVVRSNYATTSRQVVILRSMESFSMENLQAMIICAFDIIGSGRGPSAWSIIGSMTRTVEQLQLSVEEDELPQQKPCLIRRLAFLPRPNSWTEVEDRRRVFWNIFLMDRFCSITTGWNLSLTSADVKRRLPCEGALWENGEPLETPTPYFGVSDQSRNAGSFLPLARPEDDDQASLGGFAYCIEATESLSLVTSFFLQQAVDVTKLNEVQMWLMRFKELDLRLIRWKIFLPTQWQQACVLNVDGIMDPNLTLAHITHNTAVVLLHQGIAYPSAEWSKVSMRLPSSASAETCLAAATEVSIISQEFLQQNSTILTNPQFAFCLFVSGRMFLVHASYYGIQLAAAFQSILDSLWDIARRWTGLSSGSAADNLASKFASRLCQAKQQGSSFIDIRHAAYAQDSDPELAIGESVNHPDATIANVQERRPAPGYREAIPPAPAVLASNAMIGHGDSPDSISMAFPPLPLAFQGQTMNHNSLPLSSDNGAVKAGQHSSPGNLNPQSMDFDSLNQYFDYDYVMSQRVSMFSQNGEIQ